MAMIRDTCSYQPPSLFFFVLRTDVAMQKWPFLYYDEEHDSDTVKYLAHTLGYRVLYECNRVSMVLPASLVATVLLSQHQRGIYRWVWVDAGC